MRSTDRNWLQEKADGSESRDAAEETALARLRRPTRMDAIQAPVIAVVGALIREVPGTISLGQGVVHYGPPPAAIEAIHRSLARRSTHEYQNGEGLPALVGLIARKLERENGIDVARGSRIMVTAGANMAFVHAVLATTMPGDEVILPAPFYFNHEMAIEMAGCRAVRVPTDDRYQLRVDAIRAAVTSRTRAIVTISPNNPSGAVLSETSLRAVNALCGERGIYHVSDEPYEYFTYGGARHVSPGSFPDAARHTISMYSLSKAYGFAGWRVGYMVYPDHLAGAMIKSQDTILICPPIASQEGAIAALDHGRAYCDPFVRELGAVRDLVVGALSALAPIADVPAADGAFYALLRVRTEMDPMAVCERLIREHKVAVIPGTAFGMTDGCYFRVAYGALQRETVAEGIGRLVAGLRVILA
jgi:aspartate/methionine/tyrosine aminotransferase